MLHALKQHQEPLLTDLQITQKVCTAIFLCIVFCNFRVEMQTFLTLFVIYLVQRHRVEDRLDEAAVVGDNGDST